MMLLWIGIVVALAALAEWRWRRRIEREKWTAWVREFRDQFPDKCPVCSFTRWGMEMGFSDAYRPTPNHSCPEKEHW